jgi:hypothetical protein
MNSGSSEHFIVVAAHRGYWQNVPENSIAAMDAALDAGVEAVEIDIRLAGANPATDVNYTYVKVFFPTTPAPGTPYSTLPTYGTRLDAASDLVVSHDECIDRQVVVPNATKTNALRTGNNCGVTTGYSAAGYTALALKDRAGNTSSAYGNVSSFAQILTEFQKYLSVDSKGVLHGPVLIVDLKDKDIQPPWQTRSASAIPTGQGCYECITWNEYIYGLQVMRNTFTNPAFYPAVVWKMKMASALPSTLVSSNEIMSHPTYGHLVLTVNPEDATNTITTLVDNGTDEFNGIFVNKGYGPTGGSWVNLLTDSTQTPPEVTQFEMVPWNPNDGTSAYFTGSGAVTSFATYYQPSYYPEGVSNRFASCCVLANLNLAETNNNKSQVDQRGILDFATYYSGTTTITSDNLLETLNYLEATGNRSVSELEYLVSE